MAKKIRKITASSGTSSVVVLMDDGESFLSNNRVVSGVLGIALTLDVKIDFETFDGAHLIKRIPFFYVIDPPPPMPPPPIMKGAIARIATQRDPVSGANWLEVTIFNGDPHDLKEEFHTVYDEAVQLVCFNAALRQDKPPFGGLSVGTDGDTIVEASFQK
jgi:hypothetical protein